MRRGQLLGERDVGVDDPPAHPGDRLAVAQPARVQHRVDRERQRLQAARTAARRRPGTRPPRAARPAPSIAWWLRPSSASIDQRAVLLEDRRVGVPHQIGAQRLIRRLAVGGLARSARSAPSDRRARARRRRGRRRAAAATAARGSSRAAAAGTPRRGGTRAPRRRSAPRSPTPAIGTAACDAEQRLDPPARSGRRRAPPRSRPLARSARPRGRPRARTSAARAGAPHARAGTTATPPATGRARRAAPRACCA